MATGELTELETAIEKIVTVFFTYAGKEGKKGTLTAGEFKELVQLQLPNLMKVRRGAACVGRLDPRGSPRAGGLLPVPWDLQARASSSPCSPPSRDAAEPPPSSPQDVPSLEEKMSELDVNGDEELKFGEYWRLIGELAKATRREKAGKKK
ncbi:hypothetical protein QYF61_019380 [Mycteria americana]|uniref:S100/CaBP-9k-type calcium binding subdomain domain-containing protein n=1 Tax=Mycteria americana TaxID=33587 RepID=A0AAN7N2W6_MYCAM|nr:hypothetical protein QYF61_019380 [Mycteria americana]